MPYTLVNVIVKVLQLQLTGIAWCGSCPAPGGSTSTYMVEKNNFTLLIDLGSGSLSTLQAYKNVMDIDAVIISHYHSDHIADIGVLQYAWLTQSYLKDVDEILPIYGHMEDEIGFSKLTHDFTEGVPYDLHAPLYIGPFSMSF